MCENSQIAPSQMHSNRFWFRSAQLLMGLLHTPQNHAQTMRYVVLGGGIAGVCCAEELCKLCHNDEVVLVSSYKTLKVYGEAMSALGRYWLLPAGGHFTCALVQGVGNVVKYTENLENFESKAKEAVADCHCLARLAQCLSSSLELVSILQL